MKDKILTLIIGILIGAVIMACVFLIYNKNTKKDEENVNSTNVTTSDNIQNQEFSQNGEMPQGNFERGPRGDFNRDENSTDLDSDEDRPTPPDGNFTGERPDGEPPARPEDNQTTNTES